MQNSKFNRNIPFTLSCIKLHAPTEVILEFNKWTINNLSNTEMVRKKDVNKSLHQNWFVFFGPTIDVSFIKLHDRYWSIYTAEYIWIHMILKAKINHSNYQEARLPIMLRFEYSQISKLALYHCRKIWQILILQFTKIGVKKLLLLPTTCSTVSSLWYIGTISGRTDLSTVRPKWRLDGPALACHLLYSLVNHAYANCYHHHLVW